FFAIISLHNCSVISFLLFLFDGNSFIQIFLPKYYIFFSLTSSPSLTSVCVLITCVLLSLFLLLEQKELYLGL
uniref:Uncharacterized protein n=1 Tax=Suricata suricatta TaxID=37032 RepID=A0A673UGA6_SURSU